MKNFIGCLVSGVVYAAILWSLNHFVVHQGLDYTTVAVVWALAYWFGGRRSL